VQRQSTMPGFAGQAEKTLKTVPRGGPLLGISKSALFCGREFVTFF